MASNLKRVSFQVEENVLQDFKMACVYHKLSITAAVTQLMKDFAKSTREKYYPEMKFTEVNGDSKDE